MPKCILYNIEYRTTCIILQRPALYYIIIMYVCGVRTYGYDIVNIQISVGTNVPMYMNEKMHTEI